MGGRVLIQITPQMRILVAIESIDGRKGIDSLAQLCREKLDADPFSGCLFIFRSRSGKSIRILAYDCAGILDCHEAIVERAFQVVADRRDTGENAASTPGAVAPGGRQSGDRCGAGVAERELNIKKTCVPVSISGKLTQDASRVEIPGQSRSQRKTSYLSASSSLHILHASRRQIIGALCAKRGNGSKPTARCATWFVAGFC